MLQLPQITSAPSTGAGKSDIDAAAPAEQAGEFGEFLDSVTDGPLPPGLKAELVQQVRDGVPVSEVLADLIEHLRNDPALSLAPGMAPVIQTLAPQVDLPDEMLAVGLAAGRYAQADSTVAGLADGDLAEPDLLGDLDAGDLPQGEQLLGKHKALLAGRVTALETAAATAPAVSTTHSAAMRLLELPTALAPLVTATEDGDGPLSQQLLVAPRVGDSQWSQAMAQRVMWMVGQEKQSAELRLNPAHLGPVEVKLTLQHDQASLSLLASNAAVRDALEQSLPRLRDMLGQQDIQLAQVDVGQRQAQPDARANGGPAGQGNGQGGTGAAGTVEEPVDSAGAGRRLQSQGLVDAYA